MPYTIKDGEPILFEKNLLTSQNFSGLTVKLNTAGRVFDANGLGTTTATSTVIFCNVGGFADQKITAIMKYIGPTTSGNEELGVIARLQSLDDTADEDYYFARVHQGQARITRVINGVFTNLTSGAFALPQNVNCEISLQCVGNAISATFVADSGPGPVTLSTIDASIPDPGIMGFRTRTSTGFCSFIRAEQF